MTDPDRTEPEPPSLRFLRRLVTALTGVMMAGLIVIVALIVMRFRDTGPPLPEDLDLPDGAVATAVTLTEGSVLVVTEDGRLLVYDRVTGQLRREIALD